MTTTASDEPIQTILQWLTNHTGLDFPNFRQRSARQAIKRIVPAPQLQSPHSFCTLLERNSELRDELLDAVTIGETYFFRNPKHFRLVEEELLPEIVARHSAQRTIRFWSAGCSHGAEILSLAMILTRLQLLDRSYLLGTDLSQKTIERARRGRFTRWDLRGFPLAIWSDFFESSSEAHHISSELLRAVNFHQHNLGVDDYPNMQSSIWGFDLIFCRNVLLYFEPRSAARVSQRLFDSLVPGGYLLTAPSDPNPAEFAPFEVISTAAGLIFQRPLPSRPGLPYSPPPPTVSNPDAPSCAASSYDKPSPAQNEALPPPEMEDAYSASLVRLQALINTDLTLARQFASTWDEALHTPEFHYLLAIIELAQGRLQEALTNVRKCLFMEPRFVMAHYIMGVLWTGLDFPDRARCSLVNVRQICEESPPESLIPFADGRSAAELTDEVSSYLEISSKAVADNE